MKISRKDAGGTTSLHLHRDEADLIDTLVTQLVSLYREYSPASVTLDPLLASLDIGGASSIPTDPALARLLPNAYEDEKLAGDFRQVAEQGIVNRKILDAESVLVQIAASRLEQAVPSDVAALLDETDSGATHDDLPTFGMDENERIFTISLDEQTFLSWVKTLTSMRLALAARLGIETESDLDREPADDMEANTQAVYHWLAEFIEALIHAHQG